MTQDNEVKQELISTPAIAPAKPNETTVVEHPRELHMYRITESEIDQLISTNDPICLGLFTLCVGSFISFLTALFTAQTSDRVNAAFVAIIIVTGILSIYFGWKTWQARNQSSQRVKDIKKKISV